MMLKRLALGILFAVAAAARAEDAPPPTPAPAPDALRLLDAIPDYAAILGHQWSAGVPADVSATERDVEHYGRLFEIDPSQPVSLAQCITLTLENNTELRIQRLNPVAAAAAVRQARGVFDPQAFTDVMWDYRSGQTTTPLSSTASSFFERNLNVGGGFRKLLLSGAEAELKWTNNRLTANPSIANTLVPHYTTDLGFSLAQPLLLVEVAQNTEEGAYHQYRAALATVIAQVERGYWGLVLARENVQVQEQGLALARELLRQNEGKFNVGALPRTAVLEAQAEVARRDAALIRAQRRLDNARDRLRAIINYRQPEARALLMIEPSDEPHVVPYAIDMEQSLASALERRPELAAARLDVHGKGLLRKAAENQLLPRLNLIGAVGVNGMSGGRPIVVFGTDDEGNPETVQAGESLDGSFDRALHFLTDGRYYNYAVGAAIEIPLANAAAEADYAQANVNFEQSRLSLRRLQETVTFEIKTGVGNLESDLRSVEATRLARELAEENLRNQQARYEVGLGTTKDLLDFQNRLTVARFAEVEALTRYNTDLAELRRVDGTLLDAHNVVVERRRPESAPWWARF